MRVDFERQIGDALDSVKRSLLTDSAEAQCRRRLCLGFPIICGGLVLFMALINPPFGTTSMVLVGLACIIGFAIAAHITSMKQRIEAWNELFVNHFGPWPRPESWELDEFGMEECMPHVQLFRPWSSLRQMKRARSGYHMHWRDGTVSHLPEHAITPELIEFLESRQPVDKD